MLSGAKEKDDADTAGWPDSLVNSDCEAWPNITEQRGALENADDFANEENKIAALDPKGGA